MENEEEAIERKESYSEEEFQTHVLHDIFNVGKIESHASGKNVYISKGLAYPISITLVDEAAVLVFRAARRLKDRVDVDLLLEFVSQINEHFVQACFYVDIKDGYMHSLAAKSQINILGGAHVYQIYAHAMSFAEAFAGACACDDEREFMLEGAVVPFVMSQAP